MNTPRAFYDRVENLFPYPIAYIVRVLRQAQKTVDKLNQYIFVFDIIVRYCTVIILCDYLSNKNRSKDADRTIITFLRSRADFVSLLDFLKNMLRYYINKEQELFIPELFSFIYDSKYEFTDNVALLEQVINIAGKFDDTLEMERQASLYFEKLEVILIDILEGLSFLERYPLINTLTSEQSENGYIVKAQRCTGSVENFSIDSISCNKPFTLGKLQILNIEKKLALELFPFFVSDKCSVCIKEHIFFFDYMTSEGIKYFFPTENYEEEEHSLLLNSMNTVAGQLLGGARTNLKQIDYKDIWKDLRIDKEKDFAGKYKLIELLGVGGMGEVYKAIQTNIGAIRAIKILPKNLATNAKCIKRFEREARFSARVENENIVRVMDVGEYDQERFMVMEYIEGKTLRDILTEEERLSEKRVLDYAMGIISGMAWIHRNDIIHRDIKPENIMINLSGKVKIMDFGISRAMDSTRFTAVGIPIGTAQYFAPEQAGGEGDIGFYTDVYSLGVLLYEMLVGGFPYRFKDENPIGIAYTIINSEPIPVRDIVPEVSQEFEDVVMKCLSKDHLKRYANAGELLEDIKKISSRHNRNNYSYDKNNLESFKFFLEGLWMSGEYIEEANAIIDERRKELGLSLEEVSRAKREVKTYLGKRLYKTKKMMENTLPQKDKKIEANIEEGIKNYKELLGVLMEKGYLTEDEVVKLNRLQNKLHLSDSIVIQIQEEIKKISSPAEKDRLKYHMDKYKKKVQKYHSKEYSQPVNKNILKHSLTTSDFDSEVEKKSALYSRYLDKLWSKGHLTDEELRDMEDKKVELGLPEEISQKIEKDSEEKVRSREKAKLDMIDMALENYRALLQNLWSKGYLTDEDRTYLEAQKEEYDLPKSILEKIEKEAEDVGKSKK